jgi:predicted Holliday junction resolvase-like endonuclease
MTFAELRLKNKVKKKEMSSTYFVMLNHVREKIAPFFFSFKKNFFFDRKSGR